MPSLFQDLAFVRSWAGVGSHSAKAISTPRKRPGVIGGALSVRGGARAGRWRAAAVFHRDRTQRLREIVSPSPCFVVLASALDIQPVRPVHGVGRKFLSGNDAGRPNTATDRGGNPPVPHPARMFFISVECCWMCACCCRIGLVSTILVAVRVEAASLHW